MTNPTFSDLIKLYKAIDFPAGSREATLHIQDQKVLSLLHKIISNETWEEDTGLSLAQGKSDSWAVGSTVKIFVDDPKVKLGLLADSFEDVLNFPEGLLQEPPFFLKDSKWASTDPNPPLIVQKYRVLLDFIGALVGTAEYFDKNSQELVFFIDKKLVLPILYNKQALEDLETETTELLLEKIKDETHKEQKKVILAKELTLMLSPIPSENRFTKLIKSMDDIEKSYNDGYRLFVAEFSYEKIKDQIETEKLREMEKIHKTFSDIQNQILSIPVAMVIVATQLKPAEKIGTAFWINNTVLVSVWVFFALTLLILLNQKSTLSVINEEVERKREKIKKDYAAIQDLIEGAFRAIEKRLSRQKCILYIVIIILVAGFTFAHIMYFALTDPSWDFIKSYFMRPKL